MLKKHRKPLVIVLLSLSCVVTGVLYVNVPTQDIYQLNYATGIDSLIETNLDRYFIPPTSVRKSVVKVDSAFSRSVYRITVPPYFSKTAFHFGLHQSLKRYRIESPATVIFPEKNMNIYIYDGKNVYSTIRFITEKPAAESNE